MVDLITLLPQSFNRLVRDAYIGDEECLTNKVRECRAKVLVKLEEAEELNKECKGRKYSYRSIISKYCKILRARGKMISSADGKRISIKEEDEVDNYNTYVDAVRDFEHYCDATRKPSNDTKGRYIIPRGCKNELGKLITALEELKSIRERARKLSVKGKIVQRGTGNDDILEWCDYHGVLRNSKINAKIDRIRKRYYDYVVNEQLGVIVYHTSFFDIEFDFPQGVIRVMSERKVHNELLKHWAYDCMGDFMYKKLGDKSIAQAQKLYTELSGKPFEFPKRYYATIDSFGEYLQLYDKEHKLHATLSRDTYSLRFITEVPYEILRKHKMAPRKPYTVCKSMKDGQELFFQICNEMHLHTNYELQE